MAYTVGSSKQNIIAGEILHRGKIYNRIKKKMHYNVAKERKGKLYTCDITNHNVALYDIQ